MPALRGYITFDSKPKLCPPNINGLTLSYFDHHYYDGKLRDDSGVVISGTTSKFTVEDVLSDLEKKMEFGTGIPHLSLAGVSLNLPETISESPQTVEVGRFITGDLRDHYTVLQVRLIPSKEFFEQSLRLGERVGAKDVCVRSLPHLAYPRAIIDLITPESLKDRAEELKAFLEQHNFPYDSLFTTYLQPK